MKHIVLLLVLPLMLVGCAQGGMADQIAQQAELEEKLQESEAALEESRARVSQQEEKIAALEGILKAKEQVGEVVEEQGSEEKGIVGQVLEEKQAQEESQIDEGARIVDGGEAVEMTVRADESWQRTGVVVDTGYMVQINYAGGKWTHDPDALVLPNPYGAEGSDYVHGGSIVPEEPVGYLIGRTGGRKPISIGRGKRVFSIHEGELELAMNRPEVSEYFDKSEGSLTVQIKVYDHSDELIHIKRALLEPGQIPPPTVKPTLDVGQSHEFTVWADGGWQTSGIQTLSETEVYRISATGRWSHQPGCPEYDADGVPYPRPDGCEYDGEEVADWLSVGRLIVRLSGLPQDLVRRQIGSLVHPLETGVGKEAEYSPPYSGYGELKFIMNNNLSNRSDNKGNITVRIERIQ